MGSTDISSAGLLASVLLILLLVIPPGLPSPTCSDPTALGLQSGALPSSSLSASSSHSPMVGADQGRLHSEAGGGAWCPKGQVGGLSGKEANKEWLQVDLEPGTVVTGVVIQGRWAGGQGREWADTVVIEVWMEETSSWVEVGGPREANSDTYTAVELSLGEAIVTPRLRVLPVSAHPRTVCLRLEVLGCQGKADIMAWGDEYMAAIIGALVTVILCLTAIIVFILWRNSNRSAIKDSENLQCNTPGPGSSSSSQSCYTSSYTESNEPVYASSYNESTEYAAPLILPGSHCSHPAMDWATFFPPPPTSTPPLPHLLPPQQHSPRPLPPSPRPPSSHYAASNIIWAGRRGELGKPV